jgi:DNA-binding SARP family transcriptional activator
MKSTDRFCDHEGSTFLAWVFRKVKMSQLVITLFGGFRVELSGQPLSYFGTDKNRALLAYLGMESERPHRREALANLLWCEHSEAVARNSLRQALYQLRHMLPQSEEKPHLLITANEVQFNPASDHWIDVLEFKQRITTCRLHHSEGVGLCVDCLESLQQAIELYKGDILDGFTLKSCPQFTEWQIVSQEVCHHQALATLSRLADFYEANFEYDQLINCTQRKIELEPWRESAYRRQMWALAMTGQRERALLRYKILEEVLQREMGVNPTISIQRLYEQIRDGDVPGIDTNPTGWHDVDGHSRVARSRSRRRQQTSSEQQTGGRRKAARWPRPALQARAKDIPLASAAIDGSVLKQGRTPHSHRGYGDRRTKRPPSKPGRTRA